MACERAGALQRERTGKDAQILQKSSLFRCDQLIAPVQRRTQRLMSRRRGAASAPRQAESPSMSSSISTRPWQRAGLRPIRSPAASHRACDKSGHHLGVGVGDRRRVTRATAHSMKRRVDEYCRVRLRSRNYPAESRVRPVRTRTRPPHRAIHGSSPEARRRGRAGRLLGQTRHGLDDVLATIEHQENCRSWSASNEPRRGVPNRNDQAKR